MRTVECTYCDFCTFDFLPNERAYRLISSEEIICDSCFIDFKEEVIVTGKKDGS